MSAPSYACLCTELCCNSTVHIYVCPIQIFFRSGVSKEIKCLAGQVQSVGYWTGTIKYRHLYGSAVYAPAFSGASWILKYRKNSMDWFPRTS